MNDTAVSILAFLLGVLITLGIFAVLQWTGTTSAFRKCTSTSTSTTSSDAKNPANVRLSSPFTTGCAWTTSLHTKLTSGQGGPGPKEQIIDSSTDTLEKAQAWVFAEIEKSIPPDRILTCKDIILYMSYPLNASEKNFLWGGDEIYEPIKNVAEDAGWNTYTFSATGVTPKVV